MDPFTKLLLEETDIREWHITNPAALQVQQVPTPQGSSEPRVRSPHECNIDWRVYCEPDKSTQGWTIRLVYSQWADLARYAPGDLQGSDADDGLLWAGASWRTSEIPFRFHCDTHAQKRKPDEGPRLDASHVLGLLSMKGGEEDRARCWQPL